MRKAPWLFASLLTYTALYLAAEWRGEAPEQGTPAAFLVVLLFFVFIGLGGVLDLLAEIKQHLERRR